MPRLSGPLPTPRPRYRWIANGLSYPTVYCSTSKIKLASIGTWLEICHPNVSRARPMCCDTAFRMAWMDRPALTRQRWRSALVAQRWPTSSLRRPATHLRRPRRRILPCRSSTGDGTLCQTPTYQLAPIGQATTALLSFIASQCRVQSSRHAAEPSRFIQRPQDARAS